MGSRRMGKRRLRSLDDRLYSKSDSWGLVRPPMVPGLRRDLKVACIGQMHGYGFEDLTDVPVDGQTTAVWLRENENSAALALVANDADFTDGGVTLTPGNGGNDMCGFLMAAKTFNCTTDKPWWVESQFKLSDIDDCELFFGVGEAAYATGTIIATTSAGAGEDKAGFYKAAHDSGAITAKASLNGTEETLGTVLTVTANNDVLGLGVHWDGKGGIHYYGAFAATGTEVGDWPLLGSLFITPDQNMGLILQYVHTTGAADDPITVNYVRGAWTI